MMKELITAIEAEVIDQYLYDDNPDRPWLIGFSGGKDSTMLLQLVWYSLLKIPDELRTRKVYIVCNDTLVENPMIVDFIDEVLSKVQKAAVEQSIPVEVYKTKPVLEETFWYNLIGKGYPAPNSTFRWCTERLKINPTTRFILDKVSDNHEVIILLGTRKDESAARARSMDKHSKHRSRLRNHVLPNAFVYAPLADITTDEVWQYLTAVRAPWGGNHHRLITLYRNASGGDCPLVIDTSTPSCGTSRFGCWVCTVVKKDKSMEALIDNGEEWMIPLIELRDLLVDHRNDPDWRSDYRRNGSFSENGGAYTAEARAFILRKLLDAQYEIQQSQPTFQLISDQELVAIQVQWYRDGIFMHRVQDIYSSVYNRSLAMSKLGKNLDAELKLLRKVCQDDEQSFQLISEMLELQKAKALLTRKRGLDADLEACLDSYLSNKSESKRIKQ